jgi:hypothetical protein
MQIPLDKKHYIYSIKTKTTHRKVSFQCFMSDLQSWKNTAKNLRKRYLTLKK